MKTSKYFKPEEFERCNPSCSIEDMDQDFLDLLDALREKAGIPLVLNCAYRSKEHDKAKGRSGNSAHTEGLAVDIRCASGPNRMKILQAAIALQIRRIGIDGNFIHVDASKTLPQDTIWTY